MAAISNAPTGAPSATTGVGAGVPGSRRIELPVAGLTCAKCVQAVERALLAVPGVARATVDLAQGRAFVEYDPGRTTVSALHDAIVAMGYRSDTARARFKIEGITCASCVTTIETALRATPGVLSAAVSVGTEEAAVEYVPSAADVAAIIYAEPLEGDTPVRVVMDRVEKTTATQGGDIASVYRAHVPAARPLRTTRPGSCRIMPMHRFRWRPRTSGGPHDDPSSRADAEGEMMDGPQSAAALNAMTRSGAPPTTSRSGRAWWGGTAGPGWLPRHDRGEVQGGGPAVHGLGI